MPSPPPHIEEEVQQGEEEVPPPPQPEEDIVVEVGIPSASGSFLLFTLFELNTADNEMYNHLSIKENSYEKWAAMFVALSE